MTFLIDTGADISLCKEDVLHNYSKDQDDYCCLTGISKEKIRSMGSTILKFSLGEAILRHKIQLVKHDFPIYTDGIIGRDFLHKYNCNIDYNKFILTINEMGESIILPIHDNTYKINVIKIPPITEIIIPFKLDLEEDAVICNREIAHGIFLANVIIPKYGNQHVRLLNVLDKTTILRNLKIETTPLKDYNIYKSSNSNCTKYTEERFEKLLNELNLDNTDGKARGELAEILKKYQSIFHLDGEKLSTNNFYNQEIQLQDTSPVYIKNYRLP